MERHLAGQLRSLSFATGLSGSTSLTSVLDRKAPQPIATVSFQQVLIHSIRRSSCGPSQLVSPSCCCRS